MKLGDMIETYMAEHKISFRALAAEIGCDHSTLYRMVKGEPVRMDVLIKLLAWVIAPPAKK